MSVLLLVVAACGGDGGGPGPQLVDAGTASQDSPSGGDAAVAPGLSLRWLGIPQLPGPVSSTVSVRTANIHLKRLEIIGDGDPMETTRTELDLRWSATQQPFDVSFFSAPASIYSKVRLAIDKLDPAPAFDITGSVSINGTSENFQITSLQKIDLEVTGYDVTLPLGGSADMFVEVDLSIALANVNWSALPVRSATRTLDDTSAAAMTAFMGDLALSFSEYP